MKHHFDFLRLILPAATALAFAAAAPPAQAQMPPKAKERVEMLKRTRLTDVLYLNEQEAGKFFAKYDQLNKKAEDAREAMRAAVEDLEHAVQKKSDDLVKKSDAVFDKQTAYNNAIIEKLRALKPLLTDEQYAKLVIFEHNFPLQLQKMLMKRARNGKDDD